MSRIFVFCSFFVLSICLFGCRSDASRLPSDAEEALQEYLNGVDILRGVEQVQYNIVALEKGPASGKTDIRGNAIEEVWCVVTDHPLETKVLVLLKRPDSINWELLQHTFANDLCSPEFLSD